MEKENVLVSACLLGMNCRYDGGNGEKKEVLELLEHYHVVPVCPEQAGGMETPRQPSERQADGSVKNCAGEDVTGFYARGAEEALRLAGIYGCKYAVLKERSPSCGCGMIYDGTFTGRKIPGNGVTAELLEENGICVFGEGQIGEFLLATKNKQ